MKTMRTSARSAFGLASLVVLALACSSGQYGGGYGSAPGGYMGAGPENKNALAAK